MNTPEIVQASENTPVEVDIEAAAARVRLEAQQQTVNASVQVLGDDVADSTIR